jgi:hypothetical protein
MSNYYQYHVFFCVNQREEGEACCADKGAQAMRDYAKKKIKSLKLSGKGQCRSQSGAVYYPRRGATPP